MSLGAAELGKDGLSLGGVLVPACSAACRLPGTPCALQGSLLSLAVPERDTSRAPAAQRRATREICIAAEPEPGGLTQHRAYLLLCAAVLCIAADLYTLPAPRRTSSISFRSTSSIASMQRRASSKEHTGMRDSAHNRDTEKNGKDTGDV